MGGRALSVLHVGGQWMFRQPAKEQIRSVFLQCFPRGHFPVAVRPLWQVSVWISK